MSRNRRVCARKLSKVRQRPSTTVANSHVYFYEHTKSFSKHWRSGRRQLLDTDNETEDGGGMNEISGSQHDWMALAQIRLWAIRPA